LRIDGIRSLALFEGTLREAIHYFKYKYVRALAVPLGDMLVEFWSKSLFAVDVFVPVPLHKRRLRERGYNQAQLLAQHLGAAVGVPVVCDVLRRVRYTVSQTHLSVHARRENVENAFRCVNDSLQDKRVFLIDDVCTTGSTLEACSVALKEAGVVSVWALTLARAMGA
jgi:ComF family protein